VEIFTIGIVSQDQVRIARTFLEVFDDSNWKHINHSATNRSSNIRIDPWLWSSENIVSICLLYRRLLRKKDFAWWGLRCVLLKSLHGDSSSNEVILFVLDWVVKKSLLQSRGIRIGIASDQQSHITRNPVVSLGGTQCCKFYSLQLRTVTLFEHLILLMLLVSLRQLNKNGLFILPIWMQNARKFTFVNVLASRMSDHYLFSRHRSDPRSCLGSSTSFSLEELVSLPLVWSCWICLTRSLSLSEEKLHFHTT